MTQRYTMRLERMGRRGLAIAGVLALGFCLVNVLESKIYQDEEARTFDREFRFREGSKGADW